MSTAKLEAILRGLGWRPVIGDTSVTTRVWKHISDGRPEPSIIRVPRAPWVDPGIARTILEIATAVSLR